MVCTWLTTWLTNGARHLPLIAAIAWLPALAGCSSSASDNYGASASVYPSQSLADLFGSSRDSPARTGSSPVQPNPTVTASSAVAGTPVAAASLAGASPPGTASSPPTAPTAPSARASTGTALAQIAPPHTAPASHTAPSAAGMAPAPDSAPAVAAPALSAAAATSTPSDNFDAAASAYPSEAVFDIFRRQARQAAQPVGPPVVSDTVTPGPNTAGTRQPAPAPPSDSAPPAAANSEASASSGNFDAAASAYPSVALFDLFRSPTNAPSR
jgi:hypothetical protein